jgi:hypothetical protein
MNTLLLNLRLGLAASAWGVALLGSLLTTRGADPNSTFSYLAYRFAPDEGWHVRGHGELGTTKLNGHVLSFDFTQGAASIVLSRPDNVLLGRPEKLHLRVRGSAKGHPVRVLLRTHFMNFEKIVGQFRGEGEQELVFDAPPGHDWKWSGGENDGKIHGPLRLGEIDLEQGGVNDSGRLELLSVDIDGSCPSNRLCMVVASTATNEAGTHFTASMRSVAESPLEGQLRWTVRDWDGNELGRGEKAVAIPPKGAAVNCIVPAPDFPKGLKFAEAEFQFGIPGQVIPKVQACWLAPHTPYDEPALRPQSPFGMGIYLSRFRGADQEAVARAARDAGVKWSREDFDWSRIEREPGVFDWAFHDQLVEVARAHGITIYAIVLGFPSWSRGYTSEGMDQYAGFLRQLVKRYGDRIKQWEIWNEPNIFFWQGPKELYAECLIKSYQAIKETDPTAEVLGLSTAGIDYKFIERMLAMHTPFDVLTIHPYRKDLKDAAFIAELKKASDLVKLPDGRRRPVWLTEMGWATHVPHHALGQDFEPNSQRVQAELLARTYLCSMVSGVEPRTFWYDFRDDGDDPIYFEANMGIMTHNLRPKPAYIAFATLARVLKGMRFAGPATVKGPEGAFAFRFTPDPQAEGTGRAAPGVAAVIALWNPQQTVTVTLPLRGSQATFVNTIGEERALEISNGKVQFTLRSGQAVYLRESP